MMPWQIRMEGLEARVGRGPEERSLFVDLNGEVGVSTRLAILGQSGTGKSTLLDLIARLQRPHRGEVCIEGTEAVRIGYVFQRDILIPWRTVRSNLALAYSSRREAKTSFDSDACELLQSLALNPDSCLKQRPHELSGGERRRVCLAMALISQPDLLVLDEPNSALDEGIRFQVCDYLSEVLRSRQVGLLLVTHDLEEAILLSDEFLVLGSQPRAQWLKNEIKGDRPSSRRFAQDVQAQRHSLASLIFKKQPAR